MPKPPEAALQLLLEKGYENSGRDIEEWREILSEGMDLPWVKGFVAGTGWDAAVYGWLQISISHKPDEGLWNFRFAAPIYFGRTVMGLTGERGGAGYSVQLEDRQHRIGEAEFADALVAYEGKFSELTYVLREADPVDGLPLTEIESVIGEIQGFLPP